MYVEAALEDHADSRTFAQLSGMTSDAPRLASRQEFRVE